MYTMDCSKYCAKNECNTMITAPRRHKHPSSGANRSSDVAVTVNINAQFNLVAVNPIIDCVSRDLVPKYCQGSESTAIYTVPPIFVESLPGCSNRSLAPLALHMIPQEIIPTLLVSNMQIRLCLPKDLILTWLRSYEMWEVLLLVRMNNHMGFSESVNVHLLSDALPYWLARGIPPTQRVP